MKLDAQHASDIHLSKGDVVCPKSGIQVAPSCPVPVEPTDRRFAERDEYQSGQRFLNGSAPRLRRHVAFCETAVGEVTSPTAGKDQKPFREFEGGALISAAGAVPLSCFIHKRLIVTADGSPTGNECSPDDDLSIPLFSRDRESTLEGDLLEKLIVLTDTHDTRGRLRGCGKWTVKGISVDAKWHKFIRLNCKSWDCRYCGPRRAKRYRRSIAAWAEKHRLNRFVTLTLDPKKLKEGEDSTKYLNRTFAKLRSVLHRRYGKALSYIRVLEYQKNGNAHFHLLLNQFIDIEWLRTQWQALGGGWNVWIKLITIRRVIGYVTKYLTKDLLLSAPKGSRRVTTSRNIRLFEKPKNDFVWELLKGPIEAVRLGFAAVVNEKFCETDGSLSTFTVLANVA